jgi:hypothetical protein
VLSFQEARIMQTRDRSAQRRSWDEFNRLPVDLWAAWLADSGTIARYHQKVHRRPDAPPDACWYWVGALSGTGHGRFRAGTRSPDAERPASHVVASHIFGFQLSRGLLRPVGGLIPLVRHRCDEPSCHRPSHWVSGTVAQNAADYQSRARQPGSPLQDRRGPAGRATAIRNAIIKAQRQGNDVEAAIWSASLAGMPVVQDALF